MLGLERTAAVDAEVVGLAVGERGQFDADFFQVEACDFFVEPFWEDVYGGLVEVAIFPQVKLSQHLIGEAVGQDETWMSCGASEVHQTSLGQNENFVSIGESVFVDLRLDVGALDAGLTVEEVHLDLVIEVADVADDGLVFHPLHVFEGDNVHVSGCGYVDVAATKGFLDGGDFVAFHRGLQRVDGVDFRHDDACALSAEGLGAAFADIAVAADDGHLTGDHDVDGTVESVYEGVSATVEVIELRFCDGIVHIERRDEEFALLLEFVEAVDTGGGFFGHAAPFLHHRAPIDGIFAVDVFEEIFDDGFFGAFRG